MPHITLAAKMITYLLIPTLTTTFAFSDEFDKSFAYIDGQKKLILSTKRDDSIITRQTLPTLSETTGEEFFEFNLEPHEKISLRIRTEAFEKFNVKLFAQQDIETTAKVKTQTTTINEMLKISPMHFFTYQNFLNSPQKIIFRIRGKTNTPYKIDIKRAL